MTAKTEKPTAERWSIPVMQVHPDKIIRFEKEETRQGKSKAKLSKKSKKALEQEETDKKHLELLKQQAHKEVYEKSFDEGYQAGYQKGIECARAETHKLHKKLQDFMLCFEAPMERINEEVEQQLELLAVTLAQQLVRRELKSNPGEIIGLIRESIKLLPASSRKIKITINPEDASLVKDALSLDESDEDLKWTFVEDPVITRGGCIINSDQSVINVTLENRLAALAASVLSSDRSIDDVIEPENEDVIEELVEPDVEAVADVELQQNVETTEQLDNEVSTDDLNLTASSPSDA